MKPRHKNQSVTQLLFVWYKKGQKLKPSSVQYTMPKKWKQKVQSVITFNAGMCL